MSDLQQLISELVPEVAGAVIPGLPPTCKAAHLDATVQRREGQQGMSVKLRDTQSGDEMEVPPAAVEHIVALYRGFANQEQAWSSCRVSFAEGPDGWDLDIDFGYDEQDQAEPPTGQVEFDPAAMSAGFRKLLNQHAALSFEKHQQLQGVGGSGAWQMDLETQQLQFEGAFQCRIHLLGSVSQVSSTWLWAWANQSLGAPEAAVAASRKLQKLGQQHDIWEFTSDKIELARLQPELLAWVACGVLRSDFYYWANFDSGAALVVGKSDAVALRLADDVPRVATVLPQLLQAAGQYLNHRTACLSYLKAKGFKGREREGVLSAVSDAGEPLKLSFDGEGRLTTIEGSAG